MDPRAARRRRDGITRCWWCGDDPLYVDYHDREWGTPLRDERALFELLCLEGFQAGLSWITILRKRVAFREAFEGFDPEVVARYTERDVERLLGNPGIVRHRGKITATIANAIAVRRDARGGHVAQADRVVARARRPRARRSRDRSEIPAETAGVGGARPRAAQVGDALRRRHHRLRVHAVGRPRRRPPRRLPSGRRGPGRGAPLRGRRRRSRPREARQGDRSTAT